MTARSLIVGFVACMGLTPGVRAGARLGAQAAAVADSMPGTTAVTGMLMGGDVQLGLRIGERGTAAPIHVLLDRATRARRGPRGTGTFPARLRVEHAPARAFAVEATAIVERETGPAKGDSLVATLAGTEGTLTFVRLGDAEKQQAAYRVVLETPAGTTTAEPDAAEAKMLVRFLGDLGERLDPEGTPDYARTYERDTQVDKSVLPVSRGCFPRYPEALRRAGVEGQVLAQFVVTSVGTVDLDTFKALRSAHREFEGEVRSVLSCFRYQPAELRGRPVRLRVQQPFTFKIAP